MSCVIYHHIHSGHQPLDFKLLYTSIYSISSPGSLTGNQTYDIWNRTLHLFPLKFTPHNCFISIFRCSILSVFMRKYLGFILLSYSTSHLLWNHITSIIRTNPKYNHFYFYHYCFCQVINISLLLQYYYNMWIGLLAYILHAAIQYQHRSQEVLWKQRSDHVIHLPKSL